ncbi:MAG: hypothetical protein AMXMBFR36_31110 [Acidobacteriota bacterium]
MTARRLFVLALAATWLLPVAVAGGVALHVALEHGHGHGHGDHPPAQAADHAGAISDLLVVGHLHSHSGDDHAHAVAPAADAGLRSGRPLVAPTPAAALDGSDPLVGSGAPARGSVPSPPPRRAGPPLLALLSTLRI